MPEDEQAVAVAPPCGACRTLRRRCVPGCVFAPYFTVEDFAAVHGVFGASNVSKMLERIELPEQRRVAAATLVEEARARKRDPTFGVISYLRILQEVNDRAREQVDEAREEIAREFGALAASQPVDVAAAAPEARAEARNQVDAALKHAREQDARLLGVRKANEVRWRELHQQAGTGKHVGNGKVPDVVKRHRGTSLSEQTMLMVQAAKRRSSRPPPGVPDERSHQQMVAAEAAREKAQLMRQQMSDATSREETMRSVQDPAAAPQQHLDSAGQHDGTGQPRHAGDDAAGRAPGQGATSNSVLLQAMMQLAGAGDEQQHLVAQRAENDHGITLGHGDPDGMSQELRQLQEFLDMAELARKQQIMKDDVKTQMGQWHAMEQDVTTTTQQIPNAAWQHQYPTPQHAGMRDEPQDQQMGEASTAELAQTTGDMSQQFAWAQQYHHDPAAVHLASPWHHQMAEAEHQQPAAASASQVASEQHLAAAAESLSAGGALRFDNLAAHYDDTELTLGYGHTDLHQQVAAAGQVAGVQDMNSRHAAAAVLSEREMMQELAAILGLAGKQETISRKQGVTTEMGQWDAVAPGIAREPDAMTMTQQGTDGAWLLEMLERMEKASTPDLDRRLETMSRRGEARHAQKELGITIGGNGHPDGSSSTQGVLQAQELIAMAEKERKLEMLMRQFVASERAREQEMIAQQAAAAQQQQQQQQLSLGNGHPDGSSSTQGILQPQESFAMGEKERKLEMIMRQFVAAERAREQEMIAAAAQQQQQQPVAQYSGTELDISLGQGHGHPYRHQPTVQQMLQEQQLADAVGFGRHHQPNTTLVQQDAAYANGEHGGGAGATMAFHVDQQTQPNGHQMDSSLPPLPSSLSQLHAQASHQQRTDGGGQGLNSDLAAYLHYESLPR